MRSRTVAAVLLLTLFASTTPVFAEQPCGAGSGYADPCIEEYYAKYCSGDCYSDSESHPFRVIAYLLSPVGVALEWAIFRPLHWAVSRPSTAPIFGHTCQYTD